MLSAKHFCLQLKEKEADKKQDNISGIFKLKKKNPRNGTNNQRTGTIDFQQEG